MGNSNVCGSSEHPLYLEAYGSYSLSPSSNPSSAIISRKIPKSKKDKLHHGSIFSKKLRVLTKQQNLSNNLIK